MESAVAVPLVLRHNLPFLSVRLHQDRQSLVLDSVLVDTGSASTVLSADSLFEIGISPRPQDRLRTLRGIGGTETVFTRTVDRLGVGDLAIDGMEIEVGGMDYGFEIRGILGMDFLLRTGAILDLDRRELRFPD